MTKNYECSKSENGRTQCPVSSHKTKVHVNALDGLASVNATFTFAVFVGLSLTTPGQQSLVGSSCNATVRMLRWLMIFEVISFSCFFFSSLIAKGIMVVINLINSDEKENTDSAMVDIGLLRFGIITAAIGSFCGCICLMISMIFIVQIRLGTLSCGSLPAISTVIVLVVLTFIAIVIVGVFVNKLVHRK